MVSLCLVWLCLPAHAVVLRFKPKVNSIVKHKVTMSGRMEMTNDMFPEPMRVQMSMVATERQKVLGETPEGMKVHTTTSGGRVTSSGEGTEGGEGSQKIPDTTTVTIVDERGRVKQVVSSDVGGKGASDPFSNEALMSLANFATFPEGDVKPDDTWSDQLNIPGSGEMPEMDLSVNSRLLELLTYQGRQCAKVRTSFKGPMSFDMSQMPGVPEGMSGAMEATLQGTFTQYYDYVNSIWVGGDGQMTMSMTMNMSAQGANTGPMMMKMVMNMKTQMVK
jgi:hypothetical protein